MKRSTDRTLVTHVGSLVRPMSIRNILSARDHGEPYDEAAYEKTLKEEVAGVVRKQADTGIDIVSDGEYGKAGWIRYVSERLGGFVPSRVPHRRPRAEPGLPDPRGREVQGILRGLHADPVLRLAAARRMQDRARQHGRAAAPESHGLGMRRADHLQGAGRGRAGHRQLQVGAERRQGHRRVHAGRGADERARAVAQRLLQERRGDRRGAGRRAEGGIQGDRRRRLHPAARRCVSGARVRPAARPDERARGAQVCRALRRPDELCAHRNPRGQGPLSRLLGQLERAAHHRCAAQDHLAT